MASNSAVQIAEPAPLSAPAGGAAGAPSARPAAFLRRQEPRLLDPPVGRLGGLFRAAHALAASPIDMGWFYVIHTALLTATGYSITLLMASAFRRLIRMQPVYTWVGTILIVAIAAAAFSAIETWSVSTFINPGHAARRDAGSSARSCSPSRCSSPGRRSITASTSSSCWRSRPTGCCGWRARPRTPSSPCCATSSIRTSCSTR